MNSIVLLIFLTGIIFIVIGYTKSQNKCPPPKIEYRFVPRSFYEQQLSPDNISLRFQNMFSQNSPWYNYYQEEITPSIESRTNNFSNFFTVLDSDEQTVV